MVSLQLAYDADIFIGWLNINLFLGFPFPAAARCSDLVLKIDSIAKVEDECLRCECQTLVAPFQQTMLRETYDLLTSEFRGYRR